MFLDTGNFNTSDVSVTGGVLFNDLPYGDVPVLDLKPEIFGKVHPLARFWNANDVSLTHLFNAMMMVDIVMMRFGLKVLKRVQAEVAGRLNPEDEHGLLVYAAQLEMGLTQYERHWQAMRDIGYEDTVLAAHARRLDACLEKRSVPELLAMWNAYSWIVVSIGRYLFKKHWFLAMAESRPAMRFKWKLAVEFLHVGRLTPALRALPVSRTRKVKVLLECDALVRSMYFQCNNYLMRKDMRTQSPQLNWFQQTWTICRFQYKIFITPIDGYAWGWLGYYKKYMRHNGDSAQLDCKECLNDFLLNSQLFVNQVNPAVSHADFFPDH